MVGKGGGERKMLELWAFAADCLFVDLPDHRLRHGVGGLSRQSQTPVSISVTLSLHASLLCLKAFVFVLHMFIAFTLFLRTCFLKETKLVCS